MSGKKEGKDIRQRRVSVWLQSIPKFTKFAQNFEYTEWDQLVNYSATDLATMGLPGAAAVPLSKIINELKNSDFEEKDFEDAKETVVPAFAPEPVPASIPAPVAASEPAKAPVPTDAASPSPTKVTPTPKPAGIIRQPYKVFVENYDGKVTKGEPTIVTMDGEDGVKTGIFIGNCKGPDCIIKIEGKCKNITINNCTDVAVIFETCVTTVEVIGSRKLQIQATEAAGSYIVDKSDRTSLYLADRSLEDQVVVYTCQSTSTVVFQSTADGEDQLEHGIPNQILSTFKKAQEPTHKEVVPDAE